MLLEMRILRTVTQLSLRKDDVPLMVIIGSPSNPSLLYLGQYKVRTHRHGYVEVLGGVLREGFHEGRRCCLGLNEFWLSSQ